MATVPTPLNQYVTLTADNIKNMLSPICHFIGSVETFDDLWKLTEEPKIGSIEYVRTDGYTYVWDGQHWEALYPMEQPCYKRYEIEHIPVTRKEYPDPTLDLKGIYHLIKCWFNYIFVRLGWNIQLV